MSGRDADQIWDQSVEEGERRLTRAAARARLDRRAAAPVGHHDAREPPRTARARRDLHPLGLLAGTPETATWTDLAQNFPVSVAGNLLGGIGFVTLARVLQVRGEHAD